MKKIYYRVLPFIVVYFLVCDSLSVQSETDSALGSCPFFVSVEAEAAVTDLPTAVIEGTERTGCANMMFLPKINFTGTAPFTFVYKEDGVEKTLTTSETSFQTEAPANGNKVKTYEIVSITDNSGQTNTATDKVTILAGVEMELFPLDANGAPLVFGESPFIVRIPERDIDGQPVETVAFPLSKCENVDLVEVQLGMVIDNLSAEDESLPEADPINASLTQADDGKTMVSFSPATLPAGAVRTIEGHTTLRPGYQYQFLLSVWQTLDGDKTDCSEQRYFKVLVVPDTIVWRPSGAERQPDVLEAPARTVRVQKADQPKTGVLMPSEKEYSKSWLFDNNWKHQAYPLREGPLMIDDKAAPITNAFAPLRETHVIIPTGSDIYPTLLDPFEDFYDTNNFPESQTYTDPDEENKLYLRYQYNFVHNRCKVIHFKANSEVGRPDRLTYDSAQVDFHLETDRWYGLTAPLRDTYTGDFMAPRATPTTEALFHKQDDPDNATGTPVVAWTNEFTSTTSRLETGQAFAFRVASRYYPFPEAFNENPDKGVLQPGKNIESIGNYNFYLPVDSSYYNIYNAVSKALVGQQTLPEGSKALRHRFTFDSRSSNYLSPFTPEGTDEEEEDVIIAEIPYSNFNLQDGVADQVILIGNPMMSHLNFYKLYVNDYLEGISNEYKLIQSINNRVYYISVLHSYSETDEGLIEIVSNDNDDKLQDWAISPGQAFVITTTSDFLSSNSLKIPAVASQTDDETHTVLRAQNSHNRSNILRIRVERDGDCSWATVAIRPDAYSGFRTGDDSRLLLAEADNGVIPSVYTKADGVKLDINRMPAMPDRLPIGILTNVKGETEIRISGMETLENTGELSFIDVAEGIKRPLTGDAPFTYRFNNTTGDVDGRFFIHASPTDITATDSNQSILIYHSDGRIFAFAANSNEVRSLIIYSLDGKILARRNNIDNAQASIEIPTTTTPQTIIVKAVSNTSSTIKKIILH